MTADLHIHSTFSDGHYEPSEVCRRAKKAGLSILSITDHDTLSGEEEKRAAAKKYNLLYVTGWEISAYEGDNKIHILGYNCDHQSKAYLDFTKRRIACSIERAKDSILKMNGAGISLTIEEVLKMRQEEDTPVHTMHIARAVAKKLGISEGEAYNRYLGYGKVGFSILGRPTPKEAIDCILESGGFASLAHPGRIYMTIPEMEDLVSRLVKDGMEGIECIYTTHTKEQTEYFCALAKKHGLLMTGGSDTHYEEPSHQIGKPYFTPSKELIDKLVLR